MMRDEGATGALDLDLLNQQTLGDRDLESELFALFESQVERLVPVIAASGDRTGRAEAAHSLKGASAAIGAVEVMRLAGELEIALERDVAEPVALLLSLHAAVAGARLAIATWAHAA